MPFTICAQACDGTEPSGQPGEVTRVRHRQDIADEAGCDTTMHICRVFIHCRVFAWRVVCHIHIESSVSCAHSSSARIKSIRRRAAAATQAAMLGITVQQLLEDVAAGRRFLVVMPTMPMHHRRTAVCICSANYNRRARERSAPSSIESNKQTVHRPVYTGHSKRFHVC